MHSCELWVEILSPFHTPPYDLVYPQLSTCTAAPPPSFHRKADTESLPVRARSTMPLESEEMKAAAARVLASFTPDANAADASAGLTEFERATAAAPTPPLSAAAPDGSGACSANGRDAAASEPKVKKTVMWHEDERLEHPPNTPPLSAAPLSEGAAAPEPLSSSSAVDAADAADAVGAATPQTIERSPPQRQGTAEMSAEAAAELAAEQAVRQSPRAAHVSATGRAVASVPEGLPPPPVEEGDAVALTGESAQLLMKLTATKSALEVRNWAKRSSDEEVSVMVSAIRNLHSAWLSADAALINMHVEASLRKEVETNVRRESAGIGSQLESAQAAQANAEEMLKKSERRCRALEAELTERNEEVQNLTMALQQAILEQKGVAESKKKWKTKA